MQAEEKQGSEEVAQAILSSFDHSNNHFVIEIEYWNWVAIWLK